MAPLRPRLAASRTDGDGQGSRLRAAAVALSAAGLVVSGYLAWLHAASPSGVPEQALFCGPGSPCETVWSSPYSRLLGIALPWWGVAAFGLLVILGAFTLGPAPHPRPLVATVALSWAAAGFSGYLVAVQAAVIRGFCPWCLMSAICALASAALHTAGRPGTGGVFRRDRARHVAARRQAPAAGAFLAAALALANWGGAAGWLPFGLGANGSRGPGLGVVLGAGGASPQAGAFLAVPRNLDELSALMAAGPPNAPARVDVFADFQCPYCARAAREVLAPLLSEDVAAGRMRVVFYNFAFIGVESKQAAQAAVCAALQGRFWSYHDRLFAMQGRENSGVYRLQNLMRAAEAEGLDTGRFSRCVEDPAVRRLVESSYELGYRLGVRGTPSFLIHGRLVEGLVPVDTVRQLAYGTRADR